jgi:outer membrane protein assembly factor BamE (lipoprotein component of BamABCDE complex)
LTLEAVQVGMTSHDVVAVLGEPDSIVGEPATGQAWYYHEPLAPEPRGKSFGGLQIFIVDGKVTRVAPILRVVH